MRKKCRHCFIWWYDVETDRTSVRCAHCGWGTISWDSWEDDGLRVRVSKAEHRARCLDYRYRSAS